MACSTAGTGATWWTIAQRSGISGDAVYYLAAAPEIAGVSGKFFNLTIDEQPAPSSWTATRGNVSGR